MKLIEWNNEKNEILKNERNSSFETISEKILSRDIIDIFKHPNQTKYPNQKVFIIEVNHYIYYVPFVEDEDRIFLKTIIPSRKATKKYLGK